MEKNCDQLNYELKQCGERCTDLEDRLAHEHKLRKRKEKDSDELRDMYESRLDHSGDSGTCSSSDESHYGRQQKKSKESAKTSKSKPSKEPSKKLDTRVKKGVVVDKRQPRPKKESKKDAKASTSASCSEEMNWDAKVDARKESRADEDNQKHDVLPTDSTDCEEVDAMMLIWQSTQMKQKTFRVKTKKRYSIQERMVREMMFVMNLKEWGMFQKGV